MIFEFTAAESTTSGCKGRIGPRPQSFWKVSHSKQCTNFLSRKKTESGGNFPPSPFAFEICLKTFLRFRLCGCYTIVPQWLRDGKRVRERVRTHWEKMNHAKQDCSKKSSFLRGNIISGIEFCYVLFSPAFSHLFASSFRPSWIVTIPMGASAQRPFSSSAMPTRHENCL